jgi:MoaA/NifB/PqqE/SkfB family radical SAM enzyme
MIEGTMDRLAPESMERFRQVLDHNRRHRTWTGLIFTGSEVTLRRDLPELAAEARRHGFEHVRIQTHGMRLADEAYCRTLLAAGVDEYFVSVTAADAATHDSITEVPGSFAKTLRGLRNLEAYDGVVTLTNTVITRRSYQHLAGIVDLLGDLRRLVEMHFWGYWPMSEVDEKDLIVSHLEALPFLRQAIARARKLGRAVEVKNFPECLLGDDGDALCNDQPKLLIDPAFWTEFMRNGFEQCAHRVYCGSKRCLGLNTAYIKKFGWQADALVPLPLAMPRAAAPAPTPA